MSDLPVGADQSAQLHRLRDAIRKVKLAEAARTDVVVELREAERMRLEILLQALQPVIDDIPDDDEQFDFGVVPGNPPRMWIDVTAFVTMGRDKRTYRLVRDTRLGRTVLGESQDVDQIAVKVTDYVAARIVERERALASEAVALPVQPGAGATGGHVAAEMVANGAAPVRAGSARAVVAFVFGLLIGAGLAAALFGAFDTLVR
ncbi:MAG: hypothetical protein KDJ16_06275 [Hyphomicrobiales bacterium]|nr:hypothetical protein [Hyphomicrobiales bacterium]